MTMYGGINEQKRQRKAADKAARTAALKRAAELGVKLPKYKGGAQQEFIQSRQASREKLLSASQLKKRIKI